MIIIEGPDGSGKTSLVQKLSENLNLAIASKAMGSNAQPMVGSFKKWVEDSLSRGWQPILYDRHGLISEGIYGPVWNGEVREPFNNYSWLCEAQARLRHLAPTIIVCLPPIEEVATNIRRDEQNAALYSGRNANPHVTLAADGKVPKSVAQIWWQYYWLTTKENYLRYDYTVDTYELIESYVRAMSHNRGVRI